MQEIVLELVWGQAIAAKRTEGLPIGCQGHSSRRAMTLGDVVQNPDAPERPHDFASSDFGPSRAV